MIYQHYPTLEKLTLDFIEDKKKEFSAPGPLRFEKISAKSSLTAVGTFEQTNIQRQSNGVAPLTINEKLNLAAKAKMDDMFVRHYFAHYGPGETSGAGDMAEEQKYDYIAIGENLALGNFKDDQELVRAWMDSPGHRANILNGKFQEIGISVGRGTFEGKTTWIAVQIFAKPASSCPGMDESLKSRIDQNKQALDQLRAELESKKKEPKEYNELVREYNQLLEETRGMVDQYNSQVRSYNLCIQS